MNRKEIFSSEDLDRLPINYRFLSIREPEKNKLHKIRITESEPYKSKYVVCELPYKKISKILTPNEKV